MFDRPAGGIPPARVGAVPQLYLGAHGLGAGVAGVLAPLIKETGLPDPIFWSPPPDVAQQREHFLQRVETSFKRYGVIRLPQFEESNEFAKRARIRHDHVEMLRNDIVRCVPLLIGEVEIVVRIDGIVFDVEEEFKPGHL